MNLKALLANAIGCALTVTTTANAADTDMRIEALESKLETLQAQLDATADAVEQTGGAARTTVGGYGELHYNHLDTPSEDKKIIDFHRFVLFVNHEFNDDTRFFSELEVEHSFVGDGEPGELELEQAFIEFDLSDTTHAKAGLFLVPVGIINETHEPPTFYGVERNPVEKNIIPATWWEAGAGVGGHFASGLAYDLALTSGLEVDPASVKIRGGRQKGAKANASNLALTGRLRYSGISGLELAATAQYQDDITQQSGDGVESATLLETHAIWHSGPVGVKALFAQWNIDGAVAEAAKKDVQNGYFVEASYKLTPKIGVFARHNAWSNKDGLDKTQQNIGINFWPHENVVIKADIQQQNDDAGNADGFNLGIGYQF